LPKLEKNREPLVNGEIISRKKSHTAGVLEGWQTGEKEGWFKMGVSSLLLKDVEVGKEYS
jgi:hypothetical protein